MKITEKNEAKIYNLEENLYSIKEKSNRITESMKNVLDQIAREGFVTEINFPNIAMWSIAMCKTTKP